MRNLIFGLLFISSLVIVDQAFAVEATLAWIDNNAAPNNEQGHNVYRAPTVAGTFTKIGSTAANVSTFVDKAAVSGNCYKVTAFNAQGESAFSPTACMAVLVVPNAPGTITITITTGP